MSIPMRSTSSVGIVVGLLDIICKYVGSKLGPSEGLIEEEGCIDMLGLLEGMEVEDGVVEGDIDIANDGCILGSFDTLIYVHF